MLTRFVALLVPATLVFAPGGAFGQKEPAVQKESDWVDGRWNNTDLGNFHACMLDLPGGAVAKGLSIRIGEHGEAAVVYDTESATWRAGWTNGFIKFDASRYGLIRTPKPAGVVQVSTGPMRSWGNLPVHWRGLHVHGRNVLLEYDVKGTRVVETPGAETLGSGMAFTRTIEVAAGPEMDLILHSAPKGPVTIAVADGVSIATAVAKPYSFSAGVQGAGAELRADNGALKVHIVARQAPVRFKVLIAPNGKAGQLAAATKSTSLDDLTAFSQPGPLRWRPLTTRGQRGFGREAFVIDTLTVPYENPWKALFFTSGVDFLPNGDAAVCTIHGDVWLVSGIDDNLQRLTWRRFATGLFQPLGLRVRDGKIFVLGRDQVTILHDLNSDGEADFYENFFNGIHTAAGHEYVTSLELDTNGNFYYVDPRGVHRIAPDGSRKETIAAGFRNPNGMGVSPDGKIVTVAPQQGEWTPSSLLTEAQQDGWYGYGGPRVSGDRPLGYDPQLCWIPHGVDNSGGSQLWVTSERWQQLNGHLLHFSYGRCTELLVLREVVDGVAQGAVTPIPGKFLSGAMRGAFNKRDGQLYVVGSTGWQTAAARDGCLQRVRFTGANPLLPLECHVHSNGFRVVFSTPLDRAAAEDKGSYAVAQWNYRYAAQYGSKDWSIANPKKEGHDSLEVVAARLLPDGKSIFLEVPGLGPVMQYEIKYSLNAQDGKAMRSAVWGTINRLGPRFTDANTTAQR